MSGACPKNYQPLHGDVLLPPTPDCDLKIKLKSGDDYFLTSQVGRQLQGLLITHDRPCCTVLAGLVLSLRLGVVPFLLRSRSPKAIKPDAFPTATSPKKP